MMKLQQIMFEDIADEHKWMGFMYEVTHVIGSGECKFTFNDNPICNNIYYAEISLQEV